jgi:hypothetical protein
VSVGWSCFAAENSLKAVRKQKFNCMIIEIMSLSKSLNKKI